MERRSALNDAVELWPGLAIEDHQLLASSYRDVGDVLPVRAKDRRAGSVELRTLLSVEYHMLLPSSIRGVGEALPVVAHAVVSDRDIVPSLRHPVQVEENLLRGAPAGGRLFAAYCASCHGKQGEGGEGPALHNRVLLTSASDTYLTETIRRGRRGTSMEGFAHPSTVRPALAGAEIESIVAFIRTWEAAK